MPRRCGCNEDGTLLSLRFREIEARRHSISLKSPDECDSEPHPIFPDVDVGRMDRWPKAQRANQIQGLDGQCDPDLIYHLQANRFGAISYTRKL